MNFLLDTNAISEWTKPAPDPGVMDWFAEIDEDRVHLSVVVLAKLRYGIRRMPRSRRQKHLAGWLDDDVLSRFDGRILGITSAIALTWGDLMAHSRTQGREFQAMDAALAATSLCHGMTLVTRNAKHFTGTGIDLLNPWTG